MFRCRSVSNQVIKLMIVGKAERKNRTVSVSGWVDLPPYVCKSNIHSSFRSALASTNSWGKYLAF